ncbi:EamA-like transporter family protein [Bremerella volcania]|uniref:EamA-like transporter family protein n=1 Tax=Bremerella volcania TaxID=2527984 RepID=A0A518CF83_9BACT|nr:EamA family transporter [Bremerella volcania]QDU77893.1 EamA-like transporter family protein [Bremerella volcania]
MTQRTSPNPWLGLICGVLAAVGYSLANICLRWLTNLDPIWVSFFKAIPTVVLFAPIAVWQVRTGRSPMPKASSIFILIVAAIISQLLGNAMLQWSFGVVGVAMSVPLCLGTMIVVGVMVSNWLLEESLTRWQRWGTASLVLALITLSLAGRGAVQSVVEDASGWLMIGAGIVAPMLAGISYAFLSVAIRRGVSGEVSMFMTTSLICAVGIAILGPLSLYTTGLEEMALTTWSQYGVLLIAGLLNAAAFVALTLSFRYAPVIVGNAANSLQNPLSALAGVILFHEAYSINLIFGVVLTVLGVVMMGLRERPLPEPSEEIQEIKSAVVGDGR